MRSYLKVEILNNTLIINHSSKHDNFLFSSHFVSNGFPAQVYFFPSGFYPAPFACLLLYSSRQVTNHTSTNKPHLIKFYPIRVVNQTHSQ
jgi:hypothetical protein